MITYLNLKTSEGVETIDSINSKDFKTLKEFRQERKRLVQEYRIASSFYAGIYCSQRSTKDWK